MGRSSALIDHPARLLGDLRPIDPKLGVQLLQRARRLDHLILPDEGEQRPHDLDRGVALEGLVLEALG